MAELLALALSFPSVVFTVLLGVVLVYWSFVIVGVLHIGEGTEGALDAGGAIEGATKGVLEGAAKGVLEGATKGVLEGAAKGMLEGHLSSHGAVSHGAELSEASAQHPGAHAPGKGLDLTDSADTSLLASLVGALRLRSAPATVVLSLLITFSWLVCVVSMQATTRFFDSPPGAWWSVLSLLFAPVFALPMTSLVIRPLAKFFVLRRAPAKLDFIGRTCVVRTGKVTSRFGEALLEDGGAGLVIRVRVDGDSALSRGEHALIIDYDKEHETYLVEPISELLLASRKS